MGRGRGGEGREKQEVDDNRRAKNEDGEDKRGVKICGGDQMGWRR